MTCSIDECNDVVYSRGWCQKHWKRWSRHGSPTIEGRNKHGHARHGSKHPLYETWMNMRRRCENPNSTNYKNYGARGIKVCDRWQSFENFLADMGEKPDPALTLDRTNNEGDYEPDNCRWATRKEQRANKRA